MVSLYYTNGDEVASKQLFPSKSIGGYKSLNQVPHGSISSMFQPVSLYEKRNLSDSYRAFFIKNDSNKVLRNLSFTSIFEDPAFSNLDSDYEFGFVYPNIDDCDKFYVESLLDETQVPSMITFTRSQSVRSTSVFDVKVAPHKGELIVFQIDEEEFVLPPYSLSSENTEVFCEWLSKQFDKFDNWKVHALGEGMALFERKDLVSFHDKTIFFHSNGSLDAQANEFEQSTDDSILIDNEFQPGNFIGFWVKRKPKPSHADKTCDELYEDWKNGNKAGVKKIDELMMLFTWDETEDELQDSQDSQD